MLYISNGLRHKYNTSVALLLCLVRVSIRVRIIGLVPLIRDHQARLALPVLQAHPVAVVAAAAAAAVVVAVVVVVVVVAVVVVVVVPLRLRL